MVVSRERCRDRGVAVTATDASAEMIALARERSIGLAMPIEWRQVDVTDATQLAEIAGGPFGAAVCNMALMDIAELGPLFRTLPGLLAPGAPFVFSVLHPDVQSGRRDRAVHRALRTTRTAVFGRPGVCASRAISAPGVRTARRWWDSRCCSPTSTAHWRRCWAPPSSADGRWTGLREPALYRPDDAMDGRLRWSELPEIPPVLIARLRHIS